MHVPQAEDYKTRYNITSSQPLAWVYSTLILLMKYENSLFHTVLSVKAQREIGDGDAPPRRLLSSPLLSRAPCTGFLRDLESTFSEMMDLQERAAEPTIRRIT